MAFREKTLWVSLLATIAIWGWYFAHFLDALHKGEATLAGSAFHLAGAVILLVIVQVAATVVLAIAAPRAAQAPADARERDFDRSASSVAYVVSSVLFVLLLLAAPLLAELGPKLLSGDPASAVALLFANAILLVLVLSEVTQTGWQIARHRLGA